jgi:SAM-dependent methyltransferase
MVSQYNIHAKELGLPNQKMYAIQGDLLDPNDSRPAHLNGSSLWNFDLIMTTMAFHHFDDTALAMKRLSSRLRKGGICVVVDNLGAINPSKDPDQTSQSHGYSHSDSNTSTINRAAFSREYIRRIFADADLETDFDLVTPDEPLILNMPGKPRMELSLFMARGTKTGID